MLQIAFGLLLLFCGCSQPTTSLPPWQHINGRDDGSSLTREPLYHARIPETWHRMDPDLSTSIADTTTSICEFIIEDSDGPLRISIHNFPADDLSERIPPIAQISRWQRQLAMTCSTASIVVPVSHGGFTGLYIRGGGSMEGRPASILAWAMQLSSIHFRNLAHQIVSCAAITRSRQQELQMPWTATAMP